jgi:ribosomal-protein-alanine N-acetyltransferase
MGGGAPVSAWRVLVRPPEPADAAEFTAAMKASRRHHGSYITMPTTQAAFEAYVRRNESDSRAMFLACRREDGAIVGFLNISEIIRGGLQQGFIGYGGVAAFAGQGYMSEGLQLVLAQAFGPLKLHRLEANIQPGNEPSIALARRAGFVKEGFSERYLKIGGRWRDHERWAIHAELWHARGS